MEKKKYQCECGYIFDEEIKEAYFNYLPDEWTCPECKGEKCNFKEC